MNCPYPEHHSSGGSWAGPITVILVAMVASAVLGPVLHMIELALTIAGLVLLAGTVGLVLWHLHRRLSGQPPVWHRAPHIQPRRQATQLPPRQQPEAVQAGQHLHLHLGGLSRAERAEVMRQLRGGQQSGG
jgi:hypothetical protein